MIYDTESGKEKVQFPNCKVRRLTGLLGFMSHPQDRDGIWGRNFIQDYRYLLIHDSSLSSQSWKINDRPFVCRGEPWPSGTAHAWHSVGAGLESPRDNNLCSPSHSEEIIIRGSNTPIPTTHA